MSPAEAKLQSTFTVQHVTLAKASDFVPFAKSLGSRSLTMLVPKLRSGSNSAGVVINRPAVPPRLVNRLQLFDNDRCG